MKLEDLPVLSDIDWSSIEKEEFSEESEEDATDEDSSEDPSLLAQQLSDAEFDDNKSTRIWAVRTIMRNTFSEEFLDAHLDHVDDLYEHFPEEGKQLKELMAKYRVDDC